MVQMARTLFLDQQDQFSMKDDQPTLLKGMAREWPAVQRWTSAYMAQNFGDRAVALSQYSTQPHMKSREKKRVSLGEYLDVIQGHAPESDQVNLDSYVAGWHFLRNAPELMKDIEIPNAFRGNLLERVDREVINYDWISLFVGHSRVETPLHTDSFAVCVWLANLVGRKTIRVIPPIDYQNIHNGLDAFDPLNVERLHALGIPVLEAVIEAGDIFVIPPGYWHQVRNHGFTVAVSTNYLSPFHFLTFEQQLKSKILGPYLKLLKMKRELFAEKELDHSTDCLRTFNYVSNEDQFLTHLEKQIGQERDIWNQAQELVTNAQPRH